MGGRLSIEERHADIPTSLAANIIGSETARKIVLLRSTP
jgi:hypothetical protein